MSVVTTHGADHQAVARIVRGYLKGIVGILIAFAGLVLAVLAYQTQAADSTHASVRETVTAAIQPLADRVTRVEAQVGQLDTLRVDVAVLRDEMTRSVVPAAKLVSRQIAPQQRRTANRVRRIEARIGRKR